MLPKDRIKYIGKFFHVAQIVDSLTLIDEAHREGISIPELRAYVEEADPIFVDEKDEEVE